MRNNSLSKLVAYLTILGTAILIPNTIATVLSNSVWTIGPEFLGTYLLIMVVATVVGSFFMWVWVKRAGLLGDDKDLQATVGECKTLEAKAATIPSS